MLGGRPILYEQRSRWALANRQIEAIKTSAVMAIEIISNEITMCDGGSSTVDPSGHRHVIIPTKETN